MLPINPPHTSTSISNTPLTQSRNIFPRSCVWPSACALTGLQMGTDGVRSTWPGGTTLNLSYSERTPNIFQYLSRKNPVWQRVRKISSFKICDHSLYPDVLSCCCGRRSSFVILNLWWICVIVEQLLQYGESFITWPCHCVMWHDPFTCLHMNL